MGVLFAELLLLLLPVLALGSVEVAETGPGLRACQQSQGLAIESDKVIAFVLAMLHTVSRSLQMWMTQHRNRCTELKALDTADAL
eukprot:1292-Heterococcus_DN1.PRE.3